MDTNIIKECTALSLAEQITFPEVVMRLAGTGVERYIADLVGQQKLTYGINGEICIGALPYDGPAIPLHFDAAAIALAIKDIQQGRIKYREFLHRIMESGCSHYEVFISGRQAIYFGREGSHHIERFPQ